MKPSKDEDLVNNITPLEVYIFILKWTGSGRHLILTYITYESNVLLIHKNVDSAFLSALSFRSYF